MHQSGDGKLVIGWTYQATPLTEIAQLLPKGAGLKEWRPYLHYLGLGFYRGDEVLKYEQLCQLAREDPVCLSWHMIDILYRHWFVYLEDNEKKKIQYLSDKIYRGFTHDFIRTHWNRIDKNQLLISNKQLTRLDLIEILTHADTNRLLVWEHYHGLLTQDDIILYAKTKDEWAIISNKVKMTPEFMTDNRKNIDFNLIDYTKYTADELMRTNSILFPASCLSHYDFPSLMKLLKARKLMKSSRGWRRTKWPLYNALALAQPSWDFERIKPFLLEDNFSNYRGLAPLTYDNLIDLYSEKPALFSKYAMTDLLESGELDVINEEWDAIIALITLGG